MVRHSAPASGGSAHSDRTGSLDSAAPGEVGDGAGQLLPPEAARSPAGSAAAADPPPADPPPGPEPAPGAQPDSTAARITPTIRTRIPAGISTGSAARRRPGVAGELTNPTGPSAPPVPAPSARRPGPTPGRRAAPPPRTTAAARRSPAAPVAGTGTA